MARTFRSLVAALLTLCVSVLAQDDGYIGYNLQQRGDGESVNYETAGTTTGVHVLNPEPDVYLNASVYVGEILVEVDNITAKVNLDAQVLKLLHFTAGVDASIDRVRLQILNVSAKVELEARLENVVEMVNDVLHSIDLNPIVATLGQTVNRVVNNTVGTLTRPVDSNGNTRPVRRSTEGGDDYNLIYNILYSVNDYTGHTHTNRILGQNGTIYDVFLDNEGDEHGRQAVGFYSRDMTFGGHNRTISRDGEPYEYEMQYIYRPFPGLEVISWIYMDPSGKIVRTQVIAEAQAGGTSTISDDDDQPGNDL
jgi:hypothetical protein